MWLIACLLFGFASLVEYAVVQVMLNNPKRVEAEKARIAKAEQADGKGGNVNAAKKNTVNGTGTPVHISTLQVRMTLAKVFPPSALQFRRKVLFCGCEALIELVLPHSSLTDKKELKHIEPFFKRNKKY